MQLGYIFLLEDVWSHTASSVACYCGRGAAAEGGDLGEGKTTGFDAFSAAGPDLHSMPDAGRWVAFEDLGAGAKGGVMSVVVLR